MWRLEGVEGWREVGGGGGEGGGWIEGSEAGWRWD